MPDLDSELLEASKPVKAEDTKGPDGAESPKGAEKDVQEFLAGIGKRKEEEERVERRGRDGRFANEGGDEELEEEPEEGETDEGAISAEALNLAESLGLDSADAKAFGSEKALLHHLSLVGRKADDGKSGKGKEAAADEYKLPDGFEDEASPVIVKAVKSMQQHFAGQVKTLEGAVGQLLDLMESQAKQQVAQWFDEQWTGLEPEYKSVFGEGPTKDLPSGPERAKRQQVETLFRTLTGLARKGQAPKDDDAIFKMAIGAASADVGERVAKRKITAGLQRQRGKMIQRPMQRSGGPSGLGTVAAVKAHMKKEGML